MVQNADLLLIIYEHILLIYDKYSVWSFEFKVFIFATDVSISMHSDESKPT